MAGQMDEHNGDRQTEVSNKLIFKSGFAVNVNKVYMVNVKHIRNHSMIVGLTVLILDIILKILVSRSITQGQFIKLFGGFITIGKVANIQMQFGFGSGFYIFRLMLSIFFMLLGGSARYLRKRHFN